MIGENDMGKESIEKKKEYILQNINRNDENMINAVHTLIFSYRFGHDIEIKVGDSKLETKIKEKKKRERELNTKRKIEQIRNIVIKNL